MANDPAAKGWHNPAIIVAIIGAVAVIIAALIGLIPKSQTPPATPAQNVETDGGVAAGRDIRDTTITIGGSEQKTAPTKQPEGN